MNREEIKAVVMQKLFAIAPDLEGEEIDARVGIRDQYDFDSMDYLNFIIALHKTFNIDIPETDYPKLASINGCIDYVAAKVSPA